MRPRIGWTCTMALSLLCGPAAQAAGPPGGAHPRFLVGGVKAALMANTGRPQIAALIKQCDAHASDTIASGYQGFDWAGQMSACALAWHATGSADRGTQAVKYWKALLDDQLTVADHMGGATGYMGGPMVSQDDGYSMRTYGLYSALGLDWLHDAPGVDDTLRKHAISLLKVDTDWYAASGYLNSVAGSNYFAGYFLALWAAAIAVGTDDATIGPALWAKADMLTQTIAAPAMAGQFKGGDWLEGWEYGELASASYMIASTAAADNGYSAFASGMAADTVTFHLYGLRPDGTFFDSGDHQDHPVQPGTASIWGALLVKSDAPWSDYARQYLSKVSSAGSVIGWAQAIVEAKSVSTATKDWTADGLPLSYLSTGTGTFIARSGWTASDTWASLQSSGRLGAEHQHADAGHFELQRGADSLAITSADYGTYATWNNNTLLFDDQGRNSVYPPNQGAWGDPTKIVIRRASDVGLAACAQADFADAYLSNHDGNSVRLARRDWVFLRPDTLIINDRTQVDQGTVKSTFALHTSAAPTISGATLGADIGGSHLTSLTLLPTGAARKTVNEPVANTGSAPWLNNDTWAPDFRAEETVSGATANSFLHVLSATAKGAAASVANVMVTAGARVVQVDSSRVVVLPDAADGSDLSLPLSYSVPSAAHADHVVFGLSGSAFALAVTGSNGNCNIMLSAGSDAKVTSVDGTAAFHLDGCGVGAPPMAPAPPGASADGGGGDDAGGGGIVAPRVDAGGGSTDASGSNSDGSGCSCSIPGGAQSGLDALPGCGLLALLAMALRGRRAGSR